MLENANILTLKIYITKKVLFSNKCVAPFNLKHSEQMKRNLMSKINANISSLLPQQQLDLLYSLLLAVWQSHCYLASKQTTLLLLASQATLPTALITLSLTMHFFMSKIIKTDSYRTTAAL